MFYEVDLLLTKKGLLLLLLFSGFLFADYNRSIPLSDLFQTQLKIKEKTFNLWLAISPKQKKEGLSLLSSDEVDFNEGMLFIYPINEKLSFWMKNTFIALDIAYIKKDGTVSDIYTMPKMSSLLFSSTQKVRYVLELRAGELKKVGLKVGDKIIFPTKIKDLSNP